jgi:hypothetical protein
MDKALGRPSGAYRGLATRSVNMNYGSSGLDRSQGGLNLTGAGPAAAAGFGFEGSVLPPHLPEGQEAAMHGGGLGVGEEPVYDAAAAAVDMVALARNSGRKSGSFSGPADGNGSSSGGAAGLRRPSSSCGRSLASRSVGMAGEFDHYRLCCLRWCLLIQYCTLREATTTIYGIGLLLDMPSNSCRTCTCRSQLYMP